MATPSAPQNEPTMEEILASIRKIISEDTPGQPADAAAQEDDGDVLELTQEVAPEAEPEIAPVPESVPAAPVAAESEVEDDVVFQEIEETSMTETAADADEGIFSDKTRSALSDAFAGLEEQAQAPTAPAYAMPEGDSVQAVFERAVRSGFEPLLREHLNASTDQLMVEVKPLLREWMDENFPSLLENAVRTEVARVVKARGRR